MMDCQVVDNSSDSLVYIMGSWIFLYFVATMTMGISTLMILSKVAKENCKYWIMHASGSNIDRPYLFVFNNNAFKFKGPFG